MSFDLALDPNTGDFMFGPTHDLAGITGEKLASQRMTIRAKIPRGSFIYDQDGTLGSFLYLISRNPSSSQLRDARSSLQEALADMDGVEINDINVNTDESGKLVATVKFEQTGGTFQDSTDEDSFEDTNERPEFDAQLTNLNND